MAGYHPSLRLVLTSKTPSARGWPPQISGPAMYARPYSGLLSAVPRIQQKSHRQALDQLEPQRREDAGVACDRSRDISASSFEWRRDRIVVISGRARPSFNER